MARIVFIFDMLELGGAERQAMLLARYLRDKADAAVEIVGFSHPGVLTQICEQEGFPWHIVSSSTECSTRKFPTSVARFISGVRRLKPDVLLPYTIHPNVMCGAFWRFTGAKTCIWNQRDAHQQSSRRWLQRLAVRGTPRFIANSRSSAEFLTNVMGADPTKVEIVPNGVVLSEPKVTREEWRQRLDVSCDAIVCCMLANLTRNKDHQTLLEAWSILTNELVAGRLPVALVLAGRHDETAQELQQMARQLGIADSVHFIGAVDDVSGLLAACDIGVHSSLSEGCPNSVLEMMAQGLPVVGTDIPGIRDVLPLQSCSLLAPPRDAEALAQRLKLLIESPELRKQYGSLNLQHVQQHFTPEAMCEKTTSIIRDTLQLCKT
ncbi:MAG: glycosyltransferase family 4 protein [Armatimonadota bacterium]|nr:glycosyltransferase family 4 protein [Armatimonadota bacterium]